MREYVPVKPSAENGCGWRVARARRRRREKLRAQPEQKAARETDKHEEHGAPASHSSSVNTSLLPHSAAHVLQGTGESRDCQLGWCRLEQVWSRLREANEKGIETRKALTSLKASTVPAGIEEAAGSERERALMLPGGQTLAGRPAINTSIGIETVGSDHEC